MQRVRSDSRRSLRRYSTSAFSLSLQGKVFGMSHIGTEPREAICGHSQLIDLVTHAA